MEELMGALAEDRVDPEEVRQVRQAAGGGMWGGVVWEGEP
jgi:hypothetical protein